MAIHPQLLADSHYLGRFTQSHVLLHKNALLPWFILVPESDADDLLDLDAVRRDAVMAEAAALARFIKTDLAFGKTNFAAIGNIVPQLHLHVVGRRANDACWPLPVWGHLTVTLDYSPERVEALRQRLTRNYGLVVAPKAAR